MQMTHTAGGVWLMGGAAAAEVEEEATLAEAVEPVEAVDGRERVGGYIYVY